MQIETMESMAKRLKGTGGGSQADAVVKSVRAIKNASGMLDQSNAIAAIFHLASALVGKERAGELIENASYMLNEQGDLYE